VSRSAAVGAALVRAQDAVELRAQAFDGAPALRVEPVGAELDRDAVQRLEGVPSSSRLHCVLSARALREAAYQVLPISTRRWAASMFM
jgi:hypothetical protein